MTTFLLVVLTHGLAVASPGPDFFLVLRNSRWHGRRSGVLTSAGIAVGVLGHVIFCLIGLGALEKLSPSGLLWVRYGGAAVCFWLGYQCLASRPRDLSPASSGQEGPRFLPFFQGILCNCLNPKAILFFAGLFTALHQPSISPYVRYAAAIWIPLANFAWFAGLSFLATQAGIGRALQRHSVLLDRLTGCALLVFAVFLIFL